jgi:hypothetical protein
MIFYNYVMSEFKTGFVDAYRADILSMLDLAEELPLIHSPDIAINGHLKDDSMSIDVAGQSLAEHDPKSAEGIQARTGAAIGLEQLHSLGTRATMQLFASELNTVIPADTTEYTAEQQELADNIVHKAQDQIQGADHSYAAYHFIDNESGESIDITSSRITSASTAVHARAITLSVSDAYIKKEVTISEMPVSFNGETTLDIWQTISPVEDETWRAAAELFYDNGSPEDMSIILALFTSELTGRGDASHEVKSLLARFEASDKIEQLKRILEEVKQKAEATKMNSAFSLASPEMTLPSAKELGDYKTLLSQIRS